MTENDLEAERQRWRDDIVHNADLTVFDDATVLFASFFFHRKGRAEALLRKLVPMVQCDPIRAACR